ncbi:related to tol protein [Fusarium torulosum]|uniref:Related to tol protein n=1 Tax=Fusarium torulosum TaxID=33205 RepID=A0AAE8MJ08_9HYPO|nr:related to tol protein [Fusarium torulosum]
MPKRLLSVGQLGDPVIGLLEASDDAKVSFAIASYAWGTGTQADAIQRAQTTKENIGYRMASGIEVTGLPKTIQDLIKVTRQIGHRYLWLDAFCIVQDHDDEKRHQFNSIAEFYKQADILISAASASNCGEGFLQSRIVDRCYGSVFELPYEWKIDDHDTQGSLLLSELDLNCATDNDPVHMRIWTFQEHLVSSRVISFGSRQIKWTCQEENNSVDGGNYHEMIDGLEYNLDEAFSPSPYPSENLVEKNCRVWSWMEIVMEYSKRDYSRPEDRVPAFNEAMSLLAPRMGWTRDQCVYGIWKADASRQLLWKKDKPLTTHTVEEFKASAKDGKLGPSWSWATLPSGVTYNIGSQLRKLTDTNPAIEFHEIDGQPRCLTIEGFIQEADWIENYTTDVSAEDVQLFQVDLDVEMSPEPFW